MKHVETQILVASECVLEKKRDFRQKTEISGISGSRLCIK